MDRDQAARVFQRAGQIADSDTEVPAGWVSRVERLGRAGNKTFIAMLGTALLARATDPQIDPLTLKSSARASEGLKPYSARGLAQHVLVPMAVRHGVHLGVTGREPLNNQPFYAEDRVRRDLAVRPGELQHLNYLVDCLEEIAGTDANTALLALASFVRVRRKKGEAAKVTVRVGGHALDLAALTKVLTDFLNKYTEGGRTGQAFVAACLDMVFDSVETSRVNDPGRRGPGDVRVLDSHGKLLLAGEVKQKEVTETDVLLFTQVLAEWQVARGFYAALSSRQKHLDHGVVRSVALGGHGVALEIYESVSEFLSTIAVWSAAPVEGILSRLPERFSARMYALEVTAEVQRQWASRFEEEEGA